MKKFVSIIAAALIMTSVCSASIPVGAFVGINIVIDGEQKEVPENMGTAFVKNYRTFVPTRYVLENFGYDVEYLSEDKQIMGMNKDGALFLMQIGSPYLFYKAADQTEVTKYEMDVCPEVDTDAGRVYIPLRALSEAMGYDVGYDSETLTVTINSAAKQ